MTDESKFVTELRREQIVDAAQPKININLYILCHIN